MKVTLSAAMRARDVSRPRPEDAEAAAAPPAAPAASPPAGNARDRGDRTDRAESRDRTDSRDRAGTPKGAGGRGRRSRELPVGRSGISPDFSYSAISVSRRACRTAPENPVSTNTLVNAIASSALYIRAPRLSTLASLSSGASWAVPAVEAPAARMPGTLLAGISPLFPDPPITIPRLPGL